MSLIDMSPEPSSIPAVLYKVNEYISPVSKLTMVISFLSYKACWYDNILFIKNLVLKMMSIQYL